MRWLPLAEFVYNSTPHSITKLSPMYALYGFEPHGLQVADRTDKDKIASPAAEEWLTRMTAVRNQLHAILKAAND